MFLLATPHEHPVDHLFGHEAKSLAGMAERVERAGLRERLDGPFVEHARVHPLAEVVEVREVAVLLPFADDEVDDRRADVSHR